MSFKIKGCQNEYHCPEINFYQLDKLLDLFPEFVAIVQSETFDPKNQEHLLVAIGKLIGQKPFQSLAACLITPADRDYWETSDFDENQKIVGRLTTKQIVEVHQVQHLGKDRVWDGTYYTKTSPGEVMVDFFGNNGELVEGFVSLANSIISAFKPPKTPEGNLDSQDGNPTPPDDSTD